MWNSSHWNNLKSAGRLCYNQGCKKYPHGHGRKGREAMVLEPAQQEGSQKRRGLYRFRDPLWGARGSSCILGTPSLTSNTRKVTPLGWLEIQWGLQEGSRKPKLRLWSARACSLLKQGGRKQIETACGSGLFPMTTHVCSLPVQAPALPLPLWCSSLLGWSCCCPGESPAVCTHACIWTEQVQPLLVEALDVERLELWLAYWDRPSAHTPTCTGHPL